MTAFFESYKHHRDKLDRAVQLHSGWYTKRLAEINENAIPLLGVPLFLPASKHGTSFTSFQDAFERTAGIINSPVYWFLNIPLSVLNIIIKGVDGMCELVNGEYDELGQRFLSIVADVFMIVCAPLLAVLSLLGNIADVGFGVINTLNDSVSSALRMS